MNKLPEERDNMILINSIDLMKKVGVSRATLNNYIKMGIIPYPIVKKPDRGSTNARQIGFFPLSVLEIFKAIRQSKKEGRSMGDIRNLLAGRINEPKTSFHDGSQDGQRKTMEDGNDLKSCKDPSQVVNSVINSESEAVLERSIPVQSSDIKLTINDFKYPAYLINNNFEIDWINTEAEESIFGRNIRFLKNGESRNIFRLFIEMGLLTTQEIYHEVIHFHMSLFSQKYSRESLHKLYNGITKNEIDLMTAIYDRASTETVNGVQESYISLSKHDGTEVTYRAYTIKFREGILCLYMPTDTVLQGIAELLSKRGRVIHDLLKQRMPTLISFSVLVADLQDSVRICAELPPEEYFRLINQIWKCMESSFKKYFGTYGKHTGDGMVYYFLKDRDSNYLMNAIHCAVELRENMKKLSNDWKMEKGWFNDLYLNIGINEGEEFFGTVPAAPTIEFTALGDSVNYAGRLSDFARYGSIWTTKNLLNRLTEEERKSICYGVRHRDQNRDVVIENIFSRVMDLMPQDNNKYSKFMDIATLAVTEIYHLR